VKLLLGGSIGKTEGNSTFWSMCMFVELNMYYGIGYTMQYGIE
jgi:hypothetical protein